MSPRRVVRRVVALLCALLLAAGVGRAQPPSPLPPLDDFVLRVFDRDHGLETADINAIAIAPDGFLYVATVRGVSRFDGRRFLPFPLRTLSTRNVEVMRTDARGRIWMRSANGEVGVLVDGTFRPLGRVPGALGELTETSDGAVWTSGRRGLTRFMLDGGPVMTHYTVASGLPSDTTAGPYELASGARILVTPAGLVEMQRVDAVRQRFRRTTGPLLIESAGQLLTRIDARGLWLFRADGCTIVRYDGARLDTLHRDGATIAADSIAWTQADGANSRMPFLPWCATASTSAPRALPGDPPYRGWTTRDGRRWVTVRRPPNAGPSHLAQLLPDGRAEYVDLTRFAGLESIRAVVEDADGRMWLGTSVGLIQLAPARVGVLGAAQGLSEAGTFPILQARDGAVWVGTWGKGVDVFADGRRARHLDVADGLPSPLVRSMYEARDGTMWIGFREGLAAVRDGRVVERHLGAYSAHGFAETPDGTLWIGTNRGLMRRERSAIVPHEPALWGERAIWALHTARDGTLWAATEHGLFRLAPNAAQPVDRDAAFTVSIAEDSNGTLWIGTFDRGLYRYRDGRLAAITRRDGLGADGICRMLRDGRGGVWLSTNAGIRHVDSARLEHVANARARNAVPDVLLEPTVFAEGDGTPGHACGRGTPAGWRLHDGRLLFNGGVVVIDPQRALVTPRAAPTVIERVIVDGDTLDPRDAESQRATTRFAAGTKRLAFEFASLSYGAPEHDRYRYRLDGNDRDWLDGAERRDAFYGNLAPGRYTFRVQSASGPRGAWSPTEARFTFTIAPFLWQATWFRIAGITLLALAIITAHRRRVAHVLAVERLRLRIASDLHDDIGSTLSSIALMSEMLGDHPALDHADRHRLQRIRTAAAGSVHSLRDVIWLVDPRHAELPTLVQRMHDVSHDLLGDLPVQFTVRSPLPARALEMTFARNVLLIHKEALHNVAKHASATRVDVAVEAARGTLTVHVRDDGIGFARDANGASFGLASMERRAREVGGELRVASAPGDGTSITLTVPLP